MTTEAVSPQQNGIHHEAPSYTVLIENPPAAYSVTETLNKIHKVYKAFITESALITAPAFAAIGIGVYKVLTGDSSSDDKTGAICIIAGLSWLTPACIHGCLALRSFHKVQQIIRN